LLYIFCGSRRKASARLAVQHPVPFPLDKSSHEAWTAVMFQRSNTTAGIHMYVGRLSPAEHMGQFSLLEGMTSLILCLDKGLLMQILHGLEPKPEGG